MYSKSNMSSEQLKSILVVAEMDKNNWAGNTEGYFKVTIDAIMQLYATSTKKAVLEGQIKIIRNYSSILEVSMNLVPDDSNENISKIMAFGEVKLDLDEMIAELQAELNELLGGKS